MFKKLLVTLCVTLSACFVNAADSNKTQDDFLAGVQQLSEEQMNAVTGEDITIYVVYPISLKPTEVTIAPNSLYGGYIVINGDTGAQENHVYPLNP